LKTSPNNIEIDTIIAGCLSQKPKYERILYNLYARKMAGLCMRYVKNYDQALDLMHDGFITVYQKMDRYAGKGSFEGWMRRIFINTCLEYLRKNDLLRFSEDISEAYELKQTEVPSAISQMSAKEISEKIEQLPTNFRVVFNLHVVEGYSLQDIAKELNWNENTVRSNYHRARKMLQLVIRKEI